MCQSQYLPISEKMILWQTNQGCRQNLRAPLLQPHRMKYQRHQRPLGLGIRTNVALFVGFLDVVISALLHHHMNDIGVHTMPGIDIFVLAPALQVQTTIGILSAIFSGAVVDMGDAESQSFVGFFQGDSQTDKAAPQFLIPDLLERTWLDLDPSPDPFMTGEKRI